MRSGRKSTVAATTGTATAATRPAASVPSPESILGFRPGDDRKLASWAEVLDVFRQLDRASDR